MRSLAKQRYGKPWVYDGKTSVAVIAGFKIRDQLILLESKL